MVSRRPGPGASRAAGAGEGRNDPDAGQPAHDMPLEEVSAGVWWRLPAPVDAGWAGFQSSRSPSKNGSPLSVDYLSEARDVPSAEIVERFADNIRAARVVVGDWRVETEC